MTLSEQIEAAPRPSRELDEAVERATGNYTAFQHYVLGDDDIPAYVPTPYTASIDAALTLLPEGCADWTLSVAWREPALATIPSGDDRVDATHGYAATPALALLAAILEARGL